MKGWKNVFGWDCHGNDCEWENPLYSEHLRNHYESGMKRSSDVIITKPGGSCNFGFKANEGHYFTRDYELNDGGSDTYIQARDYGKKTPPKIKKIVDDIIPSTSRSTSGTCPM